jgi:hypothetical protein
LKYQTPIYKATGEWGDISALLQFHFYEPVYYKVRGKPSFSSETTERLGHWVGIAEHVGDALTYLVLTADTQKVISHSEIRSAVPLDKRNLRAERAAKGEDDGLPTKTFIRDRHDVWRKSIEGLPAPPPRLPSFDPDDLIGRIVLAPLDKNGVQPVATITRKIIDGDTEDPSYDNVKFILDMGEDQASEIVGYNEVLHHLNKQLADEFEEDDSEKRWKFRRIISHQGPLKPTYPRYMGSKWNVELEWENGEITFEPLNVIKRDDPITCAIYAREHKLLNEDGWRSLKQIARRQRRMLRQVHEIALRQVKRNLKVKYGYEVPRNNADAIDIDIRNKNTK